METLIEILNSELKVYEQEKELVRLKVGAIEKDDILLIEELTRQEEGFVRQIQELEKKREKIVEETGYNTVTAYAESLRDLKEKEDILIVKQKLKEVLEEIKFLNNTAEQLVNISTGILNTVIKNITGKKEIGYKRDTQKKEFTQNNLLNKKI